jgi:hypothetical protein
MTRQFEFLGTWNDSWGVLEAILARGDATLIPDLWYEEAKPLVFAAVDETLKGLLHQRRRVYVWSTAFSKFPPGLERQGSGPKAGKYFVRLSLGGPGLELTLPACFEAEGLINLNFGSLSYAKETFNPETGRWEKPSSQLKAGYDDVRSRLCSHVLKRESGVWTGLDATHLLNTGRARIAPQQAAPGLGAQARSGS